MSFYEIFKKNELNDELNENERNNTTNQIPTYKSMKLIETSMNIKMFIKN